MKEDGRLSSKAKFSYLFGDLGCCLMNYMLINYFMFYCTNMLGISVVAVGTIMFVARIWDAANDIAVGAFVDRTHNKAGKARPWIKWFAVPCALSCLMMFAAPAGASNTVKVAWVAVGYILFALFYTTVNLPYGSMLPLMTKNSVDRASLSSFRMIGAYIGIFIVNATALPMVAFFGNKMGGRVYAYTFVTAIMCVGGLISFYILYRNCPETVKEDTSGLEGLSQEEIKKKHKADALPVWTSVKYLIKNKAWVLVFSITMLNFLRQPFTSTSMAYYFLYYFKVDETRSAIFSSLGMLAGLVLLPFIPTIIRKFGYKRSLMGSYLLASTFGFCAYFAGKNINMVLVFYLLSTMSGSLTGVAVLSMLADTLEYGELKFGVRLDGLGFAANSFSTKAGPAIGGLLVTMVYAIGKLDTSLVLGQDQSSSALMALRLSMFVIPNLIALVQVILSFMYPLSQEKMEEVNGELANRHSDPNYIPMDVQL